MSKRMLRVGLGMTLCVFLATQVGAQTPQTGWGNWQGAVANPLGLTAEQMSQIQDILAKWQEELLPLWSSLQKKNMELQGLMWSSTPDPAAVEAKSREIGELQAEIQRKSLEKRNAVRDVLSDQQKALYDQSGMGIGWGLGPCGLGLARGWGGGPGWGGGRGWGRGRGFGRGGAGFGWTPGFGRGFGMTGWGLPGSGWGRGPCGMGLGRMQMSPWMGRWPWWYAPGMEKEPQK